MELITGLLISLTALALPLNFVLIAWILLATFAIPLVVIDLREFILPNSLVISSFLSGVLFLGLNSFLIGNWEAYKNSWLCTFALVSFFWAIRLISKGGMGLGDVKLASVTGFYLGYFGWEHLLIGTFMAFLAGATVGLGIIIFGKGNRKTAIPFGPFMVLGLWLDLFLQQWFLGM